MKKEGKRLISIIAAMGDKQVIGFKNKLPWNLPADMDHFRQLTMGKPVVFGQKTFESIGKPLSGRTNIILTLDRSFNPSGCIVAHSIEEVLSFTQDSPELVVCGGASIYRQFLPLAEKMYLTLISGDFEGDAYFPEFDRNDWEEIERVDNQPDKNNHYPYSFIILQKRDFK